MEEGGKVGEAVRDGESASHPLESGVVVAKGVDGGGPVEDVEVEVGEGRVVVELGFEEVEEVGGSEGLGEVGGEVMEEVGVGVVVVAGESESWKWGEMGWWWWWLWDWREWWWCGDLQRFFGIGI